MYVVCLYRDTLSTPFLLQMLLFIIAVQTTYLEEWVCCPLVRC